MVRSYSGIFGAIFGGMLMLGLMPAQANAQSGTRTFNAPNGTRYIYVPGQFTQPQAWAEASRRGGHSVVFTSMAEHSMVINAFGYRSIAPCHTGHYQTATGREPAQGWRTFTGQSCASLYDLFNSNGPDDGIRKKWGWHFTPTGVDIYYGDSNGKNEDAGVIWSDNQGKLEDVSVNHRGGVMVEIPAGR